VPFAEINDLRMHYELDGPAEAPVLIFSNSLGTNLSLWDPQVPAFTKSFRVLRYDSRGHGQTTATPGEYSIEQLAADVVALLDALKIDQAHFCGLSIGGMTGMWLGANAPARILKLILGNPEMWNPRIEAVRKNGTKTISAGVLERWFTADFRSAHPDVIAKTKEMIDSTSTDGYTGSCAAVRDFDFWDKVGAIRVPTLVIAGTHDQSVPLADPQRLAAKINGARFADLNAAHISNIEAPGTFTQEVLAFLGVTGEVHG
jgi:3-oxoadipate enol-lactonase